MVISRLNKVMRFCCLAIVACSLSVLPAHGADTEALDRLEKIIQQQQAQIEAQQKALESLQGQVEAMKNPSDAVTVTAAEDRPAAVKSGVGAVVAGETAEDSAAMVKATQATKVDPGAIKNLNPKAAVALYGHVNKAVLYSNDGNSGDFYLVDNDNSSTRLGVLAAIEPNDNYEIGSRIEVEYQTNPSNLVNQSGKRIGDTSFEKRHLDLWVDTSAFGKFSLGWGSTASDGTSELDLSGTGVIGYSDIAGMAGGQLFYDNTTGQLSDTPIGSVFSNMDGLGRDERIRYDTPTFGGFVGSASYITDGGGDLAIRYFAKMDAFKLAAGVAYANPGSASIIIDDQLNGSVSVLHDSGFNGTFSLGTRNHKEAGRSDGGFFYTKFGYKARWCPLGVTSLSLDYSRASDISVNGDDADTFGFQMVQDIQEWGSEVYLGYRFHTLDRNSADFDNINAIMSGMRVKF